MSTSGSIDFTVTRDQIITEALEQLGVLEPGTTANADDVTSAAFTLNMMVKAWQVDGLNVYSVKRGYLFMEQSKTEYTLSANGDRYTYDYTKQTIDGAVTSGAGTVDLTDATDFVNGDNIGLYQSDGTMLWTTGTKAANTITLGTNTTADIDDDATVYFFTDKADNPDRVINASLRNDSLNERPIDLMSRTEWSELSNKTYDGSTTQVFFDLRVSDPSLFVWPQTSDPRDILILWIKRIREDFDASGDNPDFPQRWYLPLALNLAVLIGPKFGAPSTNKNFKTVERLAVEWYEKAQNYDSGPEANVSMEVDFGDYE